METLTSVLAIVADAGAVLIVGARLLASRVRLAGELGAKVVSARAPITLAVSGAAMLGSLYFSEVADFVPCRLCWFQRVAMYPIALVSVIALIRRDATARWYIVPMAAIGAIISVYHYLIEWEVLGDSGACGLTVPCSIVWFREFGFISLAFMALAGFLVVIVLNTVSFDSVSHQREIS